MTISITLYIIIVTSLISFWGFSNELVIDRLIFYPPAVTENKEWYRFFTCGLIHRDVPHLIFNMYALFLFGQGQQKTGTEYMFQYVFDSKGKALYLIMYVLALAVCLIPTFFNNKTNRNYRSLGASGAVSAVVFAYITMNPLQGVGLIFIPVFMPGFLFGAIYLVISYFLSKRKGSTINHSAHIWGALFGVIFVLAMAPLFSSEPIVSNFIQSIKEFDFRKTFMY
jgi:membrane associated rhomboid family serine protease